MALGTAGAIRIYKTDIGYRARVLVCDYDGRVRAVERNAASKIAAERALKLALRDRAPGKTGAITADGHVLLLAEAAWYASLDSLSPSRCRRTATGWTVNSCPASANSGSANCPSASSTGTCATSPTNTGSRPPG